MSLAEQVDGLLVLVFGKHALGRYARRCAARRFYSNDNERRGSGENERSGALFQITGSFRRDDTQSRPCLNVGLISARGLSTRSSHFEMPVGIQ